MTGTREPSWWGQSRALAITLLTAFGAAAFTLPILGFQASLAIPFLAQWQRGLLWPRASSATSWVYAFLALAGLWWSTVATFVSPLPLPFRGDTFWLIIPLCAPENLSTWLVPALAATSVYTLGLAVTVFLHRPWPWLVGAWTAPLAYEAAMNWLVTPAFGC